MLILTVYNGSSGEATKALYARLERLGPAGMVAMNLMRASKASERAKKYRGGNSHGRYRNQAYDKKNWSLDNLCRILVAEGDALGIAFGWGLDPKAIGFEHVLYVDLPTGCQVSFHSERRGDGPDYGGQWDGVVGASAGRICSWCALLLSAEPPTAPCKNEGGVAVSVAQDGSCLRCGAAQGEVCR